MRSRTLTISINRKTADVFDAILDSPSKIMPDAQKNPDGSWSFTTPRGSASLKFNENKQLGILDHLFVDPEARWDIPMRVVSSGDYSEVIITLVKPKQLSDQSFNERVAEVEKIMESMKQIIES